MTKYILEPEIAEMGDSSAEALQAVSQTSCRVLKEPGPSIQWDQRFVTGDKIYCVYPTPDEKMVREHAARGGVPADHIDAVNAVIDPTTAEG